MPDESTRGKRTWVLRCLLVAVLLLAVAFPMLLRTVSVPATRTVDIAIKQLRLLRNSVEAYKRQHGERPKSLAIVLDASPSIRAGDRRDDDLWEDYGYDYRPGAKGDEPLISRCVMVTRHPVLAWVTSDGRVYVSRVRPWFKVRASNE